MANFEAPLHPWVRGGIRIRDGFRVEVTNRVSVRDRGGLGFIHNDGIQ